MAGLVSVVIPAYNVGPYIGAAIESVLAQSYRPIEVIVVDDGSEDDTAGVCASFRDRIFYVRQRHRGAAAARNTGLRRARGRLVAFLDADDIWEPQTVAEHVDAAARFPDSGLIAVDGVEFDDRGAVISDTLMTSVGNALLRRGGSTVWHGYCFPDLLTGTPISTSSQISVPTRVFQVVGYWNSRLTRGHDYDLYLRIAAYFPITLVGTKLVRWRQRATGLSGPATRRFFTWHSNTAAILRRQLTVAPPWLRGAVERGLRRRVLEIAKEAYYRGQRGHRFLAARLLLRLAVTSRLLALVAPYMAGLLVPAPVRRLAKRHATVLLSKLTSEVSR